MALGPFCNGCDLPHVGNGCFFNGSLAERAILGGVRRKAQGPSGGMIVFLGWNCFVVRLARPFVGRYQA